MKILFITHYSFLYGANKSLLQLLIDLKTHYGIIPVVIIPEKGTFSNALENNDIEYLEFRFYNWLNANSFVKARIKQLLNIVFFKKILKTLIKNGYSFDLIHTNSSATNLGGFLSKKMNIPHIWHLREYGKDDFNLKYYTGLKAAGRYFNTHATSIIAISEDLKMYYSQYINPEKIKVIYNGIKSRPDFLKLYNNSNNLKICVLGAVSENKNQIEVLKALSYLKNTINNSNFILYIVGDGTDKYVQSLKKYVQMEGLEQNVKFKGYVADVETFLKSMDLGIVASKREAFGRVTVEFMMNKIAVIASSTGANKEIIKSNNLGYLYNLGNIKQLAEIICNIETNRESLKNIGEDAFIYANNNFSSKLNADNIFSVYKKIVE